MPLTSRRRKAALCAWRAHVYDVASAFDAIVNPTAFEGALRQSGASRPDPSETEGPIPRMWTIGAGAAAPPREDPAFSRAAGEAHASMAYLPRRDPVEQVKIVFSLAVSGGPRVHVRDD